MKNILTLLVVLVAVNYSYAQWTNGSGNINNTNSGNVGIGITNPLQLLQVNGNVSALAAAGSVNSYFTFQRSFDSYIGAQIGNVYEFSGYRGGLVFETNNGGGPTSLSEAMRINSWGNVGIGTTTPDEKLVVNGSIKSLLTTFLPAKNVVRIIPIGYSGITGAQNWAIRGVYQYPNGVGDNADGGDLDIVKSQNGNTILATKTDGTSLGNVGIGTTSPDQKLTVNGTIHSKEVKVDLNVPAPDYVFDADYQLKTLQETKAYIDKNHHLPEMPSADQLAKNGLNLGEMNLLLLKKVEELTLHLIEKEKQVNDLSDKLTKYDEQQAQLKLQLETLTKEIHKK